MMARDQSTRPNPSMPETLALRPREAAAALGISERKFWELANRGEVPSVKLGRARRFPVDALRAWLADQAAKGVRR